MSIEGERRNAIRIQRNLKVNVKKKKITTSKININSLKQNNNNSKNITS